MDRLLYYDDWMGPDLEVFSLRKTLPEYSFWKAFLPMVNEAWSAEFDKRTAGSGSLFLGGSPSNRRLRETKSVLL